MDAWPHPPPPSDQSYLHQPLSPSPHTPQQHQHQPQQAWAHVTSMPHTTHEMEAARIHAMLQHAQAHGQAAAAAASSSSSSLPAAALSSSSFPSSSSAAAAVPSSLPLHRSSTSHSNQSRESESYASKLRAEVAKFGDPSWFVHFVDYTQLRQIIKRIVHLEMNPAAQLSAEEAAVHQRALPAFSVSSTSSTASQQLRDIFWLMLGQELVKINAFFMRSEHELATRMHGELRLEHRLFDSDECRAKIHAEHQSYLPLVMQQLVARRAESGLHSSGLTVHSPEFLAFQQTLFPSTNLSPQVSLMFLQALKELHPTLWSNIATNARALLPDLLSLIPYLPDATVLSLMRAFLQAILHMERLQKYGVINATIVLKLLKLYDFHTQRHAERAYLSKLFAEPMFTSATIGQLITQAQACIHEKLLPLKLAAQAQATHSPAVSRIQAILQEKLCPLCGGRAHFPVVLRCNHRACFSCLAKHSNFGSICPVQGCNFHLKAASGTGGATSLARSQSKESFSSSSGVGELNPGDLQVESVLSKLMAISLATHEPESKQKAATTAAASVASAAQQPQQWVGQPQASSSALPQSVPRKYRSSSVLIPGQYPPQSGSAAATASPVVQAQLVTPHFARGHSGNSDGTTGSSSITPTLATIVMAKPVSPSLGSAPKPAVAVATAAVVAGGGAGAGAGASGPKASCHNCKTMREPRLLITCTVDGESGKRRRCRKRFCGACLMRMYSLDIHRMAAAERDSFQCPACLACCVCAACKKKDLAAGAPPVPMNPNTGLPLHSPYTHLQGSQIAPQQQQPDASGFISHHATPVHASRSLAAPRGGGGGGGGVGDDMQLIDGEGSFSSSSVPPHQTAASSVADGSVHSRASSSVVLEFAPSLGPAERRRVSLPEAALRSQMETAEAALAAAAANAASNLLSPEALSPHSKLYQRRKSAGQIQNLEPPGASSMGVFFNGARTPGHLSPLSIVVGVQGASPLSPLTPNDGSPARSPRDGGKSPTLAATRRLLNRGVLTVTPGGGSLPTLPSERGVRDHPYPKADLSPRVSPRGLPRTLGPGKDGRVRSASVDGPIVNASKGAAASRHPLQGTNASPATASPAPGDLFMNPEQDGSAVVSATTSAATSSVSSAQPSPSLHAMQAPSFDLQMQTAQLQSQLATIASQLQSLQSHQAYDAQSNLPLSPGSQQSQLLATQQQLAIVSRQLFMLQHQQQQQAEQQQQHQQQAQQYHMQQQLSALLQQQLASGGASSAAAAAAGMRPLDTTSRMGSLESIPPESGDFSDTISPHRVNGMLVSTGRQGALLMDSPHQQQQQQVQQQQQTPTGRALLDHPPSIDRSPSGDSAMASLSRMASLEAGGSALAAAAAGDDPGHFFLRLNSQPHPHQIAVMSQYREQQQAQANSASAAHAMQQGVQQRPAGPPMLCGSDDSASPEMYSLAGMEVVYAGSSADVSPTGSGRSTPTPLPPQPPSLGGKQPSTEFDVNSFLQ